MRTVFLLAILAALATSIAGFAAEQPSQKASDTSATMVITSGGRVRIGTSHDVVEVQGLLLSVAQITLPSSPVPPGKTPEQLIQLPKTETRESPKPTSPRSSGDQKPGH